MTASPGPTTDGRRPKVRRPTPAFDRRCSLIHMRARSRSRRTHASSTRGRWRPDPRRGAVRGGVPYGARHTRLPGCQDRHRRLRSAAPSGAHPGTLLATTWNDAASAVSPHDLAPDGRSHVLPGLRGVRAHVGHRLQMLRITLRHLHDLRTHLDELASSLLPTATALVANRQRDLVGRPSLVGRTSQNPTLLGVADVSCVKDVKDNRQQKLTRRLGGTECVSKRLTSHPTTARMPPP